MPLPRRERLRVVSLTLIRDLKNSIPSGSTPKGSGEPAVPRAVGPAKVAPSGFTVPTTHPENGAQLLRSGQQKTEPQTKNLKKTNQFKSKTPHLVAQTWGFTFSWFPPIVAVRKTESRLTRTPQPWESLLENFFVVSSPRLRLIRHVKDGAFRVSTNRGTKRYPKWQHVAGAQKMSKLLEKLEKRAPELVPPLVEKIHNRMRNSEKCRQVMLSPNFPTPDWEEN